jgi:uncharacterized protein YegP (UPF0339 family)
VPADGVACDVPDTLTVTTGGKRKVPMSRFEVYEVEDGKWGWRLIARNGEILATGDGYKTRNGRSAEPRACGAMPHSRS